MPDYGDVRGCSSVRRGGWWKLAKLLMAASCGRDVRAVSVTDERVIRVAVEHWGLPEGADATVAWDPVRVGRDAVAGSTCGIWRARVASASESISLVVKILHLADTGSRLWPASEKPSDPMYWRREADALRAFEAEQLSGPFQAGRCRVVHERDDHHVELWLDDQQGEPGSTWDIGRLALASRHLGETQGAVTARGQVAEAWWSQGWLRAYTDRRYVDVAMLTDSSLWNLPHVRGHYDPAVGQALAKIWANRGELLSLVDHAPSTLCHMDLWPPNLFSDPDPARADDCTIAIDWAYAGRGAVGEDIGNLIPDSVMDGFVSPADAPTLAEEVFESYVEGLRRSGCRIDAAIVRFVCGTVMAVKYVWMTPRMLQLADDIQQSLEIDAIDNMPLQQAFAARAASAAITARFGLEALSKVDRMVGLL